MADVLTLCDALEQLRAWNSQVAETLLSRQEEKDFEIIRLSRTNRTLLKELGELEVECAKHKAQAEASARLAADLVCERDSLLPQAGPTDSP